MGHKTPVSYAVADKADPSQFSPSTGAGAGVLVWLSELTAGHSVVPDRTPTRLVVVSCFTLPL